MVDAADLKSASPKGEREFESRPGHTVFRLAIRIGSADRGFVAHVWPDSFGEERVERNPAGVEFVLHRHGVAFEDRDRVERRH